MNIVYFYINLQVTVPLVSLFKYVPHFDFRVIKNKITETFKRRETAVW